MGFGKGPTEEEIRSEHTVRAERGEETEFKQPHAVRTNACDAHQGRATLTIWLAVRLDMTACNGVMVCVGPRAELDKEKFPSVRGIFFTFWTKERKTRDHLAGSAEQNK